MRQRSWHDVLGNPWGMTSVADDKLVITRYGPVETRAGIPFNEQPDGSSALWFEVVGSPDSPLAVEFDGAFLKSARSGDLLTALLPSALIREPRGLSIRVFDEARPDDPVRLDFHVLDEAGCKVRGKGLRSVAETPIPDFFMIGPPRSGTTSMYWRLRAHPDVYMSRIKEPYFFDPRAAGVLDEAVLDKAEYLSLFRFTPLQSKVIGEASTTYASSPEALRRIRAFNPQARALMILRNPLTASVSLYLQHRKGGRHEHASSFRQAWQECKDDQARPFISNYRALYRIGDQLRNACETFGPERLHVMLFDDLVDDGAMAYAGVLGFLGLRVDSLAQLEKTNSSQLTDIGSVVPQDVLREVTDYFLPQIRIVSEYTGRELGHWIAG